MAAQDKANMRSDIWDVFINHDPSPFWMTVSKSEDLDLVPVTTQRFGSTPIAYLVQGHKNDLSFEFQEWTIDDLKRWNGIVAQTAAVNKLPAVGSQAPTNHVRLHNQMDGEDVSKDIVFPAVVFGSFSLNGDGRDDARQVVTGMAIRDTVSGDVVQYGYVAPA